MKDHPELALILYGSQTGNAKAIAETLQAKFAPLMPPLIPLNDALEQDLSGRSVVVICSTTGNGEPPENAAQWWRQVRKRDTNRGLYAGTRFAVLGLGDTNYDNFCHMGVAIDRRLAELGGQRAMPLVCADEAGGIEDTADAWMADVINLFMQGNSTMP